jgi:hypothetical protein
MAAWLRGSPRPKRARPKQEEKSRLWAARKQGFSQPLAVRACPVDDDRGMQQRLKRLGYYTPEGPGFGAVREAGERRAAISAAAHTELAAASPAAKHNTVR